MIPLKTSLLSSVKHFINSPLVPWQGQPFPPRAAQVLREGWQGSGSFLPSLRIAWALVRCQVGGPDPTCWARICIFTRCPGLGEALGYVWGRERAPVLPFHPAHAQLYLLLTPSPLLSGGPGATTTDLRPPEHGLCSHPSANHNASPSGHTLGPGWVLQEKERHMWLRVSPRKGPGTQRSRSQTQMPGPHPGFPSEGPGARLLCWGLRPVSTPSWVWSPPQAVPSGRPSQRSVFESPNPSRWTERAGTSLGGCRLSGTFFVQRLGQGLAPCEGSFVLPPQASKEVSVWQVRTTGTRHCVGQR